MYLFGCSSEGVALSHFHTSFPRPYGGSKLSLDVFDNTFVD